MYSPKVRESRRCRATSRNGMPCEQFACWGDTRCRSHGGRKRQKPPVCRCGAYAWPHRPTSGLCRWPDPPERRSAVPAGAPSRRRPTRFRCGAKLAELYGRGMPPALAAWWADRLRW